MSATVATATLVNTGRGTAPNGKRHIYAGYAETFCGKYTAYRNCDGYRGIADEYRDEAILRGLDWTCPRCVAAFRKMHNV